MEKEKLEVKIAASKCETCVTKPCQIGCPLNIDIPEFIENVKNNNYEEAFKVQFYLLFVEKYVLLISNVKDLVQRKCHMIQSRLVK